MSDIKITPPVVGLDGKPINPADARCKTVVDSIGQSRNEVKDKNKAIGFLMLVFDKDGEVSEYSNLNGVNQIMLTGALETVKIGRSVNSTINARMAAQKDGVK